ncbi:hypothetical protein [Nguyenibacter sp. L1]|uniref:hypothetical protein n=1 Tax=Nguyenibacter sp. L1 TaxID=3049350 RepID=UPI002B4A6B62|nr:hypothetical protein [Nguyenibacter sp. L1]WRH87105.1 hypothetical protein QN315_14080 [Nguyenibacter sp. L1]
MSRNTHRMLIVRVAAASLSVALSACSMADGAGVCTNCVSDANPVGNGNFP